MGVFMHLVRRPRGRHSARGLMLLVVACAVACVPPVTIGSSTPTASASAPAPASPVPTTAATPQSTAAATPSTAPSSPTSTRSPEQLADALADALGPSDYALLQTLIT